MQSTIVSLFICALVVVTMPGSQAAESCVPVTGACTIGSVGAPCCLPSVCKTVGALTSCTGPSTAVACMATGTNCIAGEYPYCCPQQTCQGGICKK